MAFVKHVDQRSRSALPARVALSSNGGSKLPCLRISLKASFAAEAQIKSTDRFDLMFGTDDDLGVVRLQRDADGTCAPRLSKAAASFRFAHVEQHGTVLHAAEKCAAEIIKDKDVDAIEITLPSWAAEQQE
ncbi:hypothetical protein [Bradyrhizobium sp. SZCCHNRI1058]|uniref:hypothetical protein n=1 Tax=Bradyrhizobium sp. SZCCHNRI1058 TaxID=3057279 RepID=UPI0029162F4A|nr:hypothetical protein [Bradyrhizobium sp. SZCCHNRI1058]